MILVINITYQMVIIIIIYTRFDDISDEIKKRIGADW